MREKTVFDSDDIKKAAAALKKIRPAYETLIDFYAQVFSAQETSKRQIDIVPIRISEEVLSLKAKENFPLINLKDFVIDAQASEELLVKICKIAQAAKIDMSVAAATLSSAIERKNLDPRPLFDSLLHEDDLLFDQTAENLEIDKEVLAFFVYSSLKPSLSLCAEQLSVYLDTGQPWQKGYCPVCGNLPVLSMLEGEGERFLICRFCWYKWSTKRVFCPYCDDRTAGKMSYFFSEDEKEYRVYVCDHCKKYLKTIDLRKAERIIYPPLEQVATLHLDIKAKEMGFQTGLQILF